MLNFFLYYQECFVYFVVGATKKVFKYNDQFHLQRCYNLIRKHKKITIIFEAENNLAFKPIVMGQK